VLPTVMKKLRTVGVGRRAMASCAIECRGEPWLASNDSRAPHARPNTNGSQFFITVGNTDWLTGKHTIFAEVVEGLRDCGENLESRPQ